MVNQITYGIKKADERYGDLALDTLGFAAPVGLTVTERSHPYFQISYDISRSFIRLSILILFKIIIFCKCSAQSLVSQSL